MFFLFYTSSITWFFFLPSIKYFGYKIGMQLINFLLVVEQNNFATTTVNAYIVFDLQCLTYIIETK